MRLCSQINKQTLATRRSRGKRRVRHSQGHRLVGAAKPGGWDQWRFASLAHPDFSRVHDGGPALEASLSHPTLKKVMALTHSSRTGRKPVVRAWNRS